jgi:cytosol alanyl aminopeptidase
MSRTSALLASLFLAHLSLVACSAPATTGPGPGPVASAPPAPPEAPAALDPPQPQLRLPRNFVPTAVAVRLGIDPTAPGFTGAVEITGIVSERTARIWLHAHGLTVRSAQAIQGETRVALEATTAGVDLLSLRPVTPLPAGSWTLALQYEGRYEPVSTVGVFRQTVEDRQYVATQLESIFARRVFPSFDEPDVKVPWQLTLDVPIEQVAVANTPVVSETALDASHKRVVFAPTRPLPSYLIAFGVGPYDLVDAGKTRSGVPVRIIVFKGKGGEAQWAAQTSAKIVDALEEWFGTPYPYEKLDMIAIPVTAGFGAMENAGLITYAQRILLHDPKTITQVDRYRWLTTAGHEIAHQWFGDLVTMQWWDDIWLNEGFARWMEPKVVAALENKLGPQFSGALGAELSLVRTREQALGADSVVSARRVRQPISTAGDIFTAFDSITYDKGASILTMFEQYVGADVLQRGVRDYLAAHRHGNATSADFIAAIAATAGKELGPAVSSFLDQAGAPLVESTVLCGTADGGAARATLRLEQSRYLLPGSPPPPGAMPSWRIPVCVAYDRDGGRGELCTVLDERMEQLELPGRACPRWLMLNAGGHGYYRSKLQAGGGAASYEALRDLGWKFLTPMERLVVFSDVSSLATSGDLEIGLSMSLVPKLLAEKNRGAVVTAIGRVEETRELLGGGELPAYDAWIVATFGPMARALTWKPRADDRLDAEVTRRDVLELAAWAGEPSLRKAAVAQSSAKAWRNVPAAMRELVWGVAADVSPQVFEQLLAAVVVEPNADVRGDLLSALSSVGDEPRLRSVLGLLFEPRIDPREAMRLLFSGRTPLQRNAIATYFLQHLEPLLARLPGGSATGSASRFAFLFTRVCDATRREELAGIIQQHFGSMPDGQRVSAQAIERLDQCIAIRASRGPSASAWLAGQKQK